MKKLLVSIVSVALVLLMGFAVGCGKTNTPALRISLRTGGQNQNGVYVYQCKEGETSREFKLYANTWSGESSQFTWTLGTTNKGTGREVTIEVEASEDVQTVTLTYTYAADEKKVFGGDATATATLQVKVIPYVAPSTGA